MYLLYGKDTSIVPEEFISVRNLEEDRKKALENSNKNFIQNKTRLDKNKKKYEFKKNDLVYVDTGSKLNRKKLDKIRKGPFKILQRVSNSIYKVNYTKKGRNHTLFHVNKLIPFSQNSSAGGEM